ncbi:MAG: NADH-quinone oxidoreductase subunit NuoE [Dehalococcoidales bacterium]|nr:NADH-quinone oxidoreductase subunit NuoE [Dehalococcoidales bacterium]
MDTSTLDEVLAGCKSEPSALMEVLRRVQDKLGYLPEEAIERVAKHLRMSPTEVYGVATFYSHFRLTPRGRYLVRVCRGTACHVRGGPKIRHLVEQELGLAPGETGEDMLFSYETVACVGACALAPTMVVEDVVYGEMTPERVKEVLRGLRGGSQ